MSWGFWSGVEGNHSAPAWAVTVLSCSMAAGRYTSPDTVSTFFLRRSIRCLASLAVVVVLPAPCRPAIRMTAGGWALRLMSATPSPMVAASSLLTMDTSSWPGCSEPSTSWPSAFSLTRATKSRTTGRATSASSRAMRTSRSMSCTLDSVMRAWPRISLTSRESLSVRAEAISGEELESSERKRCAAASQPGPGGQVGPGRGTDPADPDDSTRCPCRGKYRPSVPHGRHRPAVTCAMFP